MQVNLRVYSELFSALLNIFASTPSRNRTYNCPLGGGCYIHLTMRACRLESFEPEYQKSNLYKSYISCGDPVLLQIFLQQIHFVKFLPREIEIVAAKVSVSCGSLVDRAAQVEHLDDAGWTQVEILADDID